jgi:hypothetical protein
MVKSPQARIFIPYQYIMQEIMPAKTRMVVDLNARAGVSDLTALAMCTLRPEASAFVAAGFEK